MVRLHTFLLLLMAIPSLVQSITSTIRQHQVVAKGKTFRCNFTLKHTDTEVNIETSKVRCVPKRPKGIRADVELAVGNYSFIGTIKIPNRIISMDVSILTTTMGQGTTLQPHPTSGPEEMEFKKLYQNSSSKIMPEYKKFCGIDRIEGRGRSYTSLSPDEFWADTVIPWSFVSDGDEFAKYAVHTDDKVGLSKDDVETVMAAMRQIEDKTCIKFNMVRPVKGQPWLFISRDTRHSDRTCQIKYIKSNLVGRDINGVGDIYESFQSEKDGDCFSGAYAYGGSSSPQNLVISNVTLSKNNQDDIGLMIHEILHNLGIGHTQKRQDASENIEIKWGNIEEDNRAQYNACFAKNNWACRWYNDYTTEYDCMSIMHYRDRDFITDEAHSNGEKTMVPKKAGCDLTSNNNILRNSDVEIIRKMYCANSPMAQVVMSNNYPSNYPDNKREVYPITVDDGHVVKLTFTDLQIEEHERCEFDWLQVVDGDGTILLDRTCGDKKPPQITSKTKSVKIIFFSDSMYSGRGFRAEYEAVKSTPTPVHGGWSDWSGFSTCSNKKDGKSTCRKKRVRYCNNPAAQHGGVECPGNDDMYQDCEPTSIDPSENNDCVLHGGWTAWSGQSSCNADCKTTRTRTCTNPPPVNSKECEGATSESSDCTGDDCPSSTSGTVKSPNYPENYPDDIEYLETQIVVTPGSTIELSFTTLDIELEASCGWDYVIVLDSDGTTQLAKLCGKSLPSPIRSTGYRMSIVFHSDEDFNSRGFLATWREVAGVSTGVVTSPGHPGSYPNDKREVDTIYVPEGFRIELTFTALSIEELGGYCLFDHLTIYDGSTQNDPKLIEICGFTLPDSPVVSTGNAMTLVFVTDAGGVFEGYNATWIQI